MTTWEKWVWIGFAVLVVALIITGVWLSVRYRSRQAPASPAPQPLNPTRTEPRRTVRNPVSSRNGGGDDPIFSNPLHPMNPLSPISPIWGGSDHPHQQHGSAAPDPTPTPAHDTSSYDSDYGGSSGGDSGSSDSGGGGGDGD